MENIAINTLLGLTQQGWTIHSAWKDFIGNLHLTVHDHAHTEWRQITVSTAEMTGCSRYELNKLMQEIRTAMIQA